MSIRLSILGLALVLLSAYRCGEPVVGGECEPGRVYCEGDVALTCLADGRS
ncbi:MAG: hypothetical protein RBU30_13460 [Polyangia bacterium]|nr:hypothetical protein [Polyangia bacterium]